MPPLFTSRMKMLAALWLAATAGFSAYTPVAQALNFGNMWNPSRWMGGGNHYNDYYDDGLYGSPWGAGYGSPWGGGYGDPYGGYGGYGGGPWGVPYGAPGYGGGYPVVGYGASAAPAPSAASTPAQAAPAPNSAGSKAEIDALKRRIEELESAQRPAPASARAPSPPLPDQQSAPTFRPMNKY
ncbi:MAG TPA: hypothetical protein VES73_15615 [Lamprocystis sp. (in: g-proteobacteria)]|nr:hypothetical protein [Lamprocystis sp. (in: g-proteobacteria)]